MKKQIYDCRQSDLTLGLMVDKLKKDAFDVDPDYTFGDNPQNGLYYYTKLIKEWGDIPLGALKENCTPELYEAGQAFIAASLTLIEIYVKRLSVFVYKEAPIYYKCEADAYNIYDIEMDYFDKEIKRLGSNFANIWTTLYPDGEQDSD